MIVSLTVLREKGAISSTLKLLYSYRTCSTLFFFGYILEIFLEYFNSDVSCVMFHAFSPDICPNRTDSPLTHSVLFEAYAHSLVSVQESKLLQC